MGTKSIINGFLFILHAKLLETDRIDWFNEEQDMELRKSNIVTEPDSSWEKINLPSNLKSSQLEHLKSLSRWRELKAITNNIPKRWIFSDSELIKIITARAKDMSISNDQYEFSGKAFNICVCNAQYFGGGWNISPKSSLQDGLFNIQVFAVTKIKAMKIFFLAKKGLHLRESSVKLKRLDKLTINSNDPIEIDGDFFGYGPANIIIKKRAIRFKI